jgi:glycosyltransferase involved in cell wall biosynthesis
MEKTIKMNKGKLKIAYINDQIFPCSDTDCEQIMQTVSTMGKKEDVHFIIPQKWGDKPTNVSELADYYQIEPSFKISIIKSLFPSARFIEKPAHAIASVLNKKVKGSDVIYTRNIPTVLAALFLSDKTVFYETFRNWPDQIFFMGWLFRRITGRKRFGGMILHSQFAADSFIKAGADPEKIVAKRNGYNPDIIKPVLSKEEARKKLELPQGKTIITYAGHVSPKKGLLGVLDLADSNKGAQFVIAGSKGRTPVEERAENMENVLIVPWLKFDKVVEYLYASDILIIPPTLGPLKKVGNTVLPIKTFLYMACNRVIFGPLSPDLEGVLTDGKNAKLVKPDNFNDADKGLKELLNSPELCKRLAQKAYNDVKDLTYQKRSEDIIDFVKERIV